VKKKKKNHNIDQSLKELIEHYKEANIGLEKESLRFSSKGISKESHPKLLGSSLTNKYITTDFSEALLEFITPPVQKRGDEILFLESAHHFTHHNIQGQKLWPFSVAPFTKDDEDIPIAYYGESNLAKFKELYRLGLSNRYGRPMQAISGIHFNYSFNDSYIKRYKLLDFKSSSASNNQLYLNTLRNIYRTNWLVLYLFGSSPVVSNNLIKKNETDALSIDSEYSYFPEATSLRMSDLGYQNTINEFEVCLDSLEQYTDSLIQATHKFCNKFENIDLHSQINSNILQIEDEYYSAARPKNSVLSTERLAKKLIKYGI
jgi:glutamate--cysteine ligase